MKKRIIAAISLLLCLCIAFALTGKRGEEPEQTEQEETQTTAPVIEKNIILGYYQEKSLNPFLTDSPTNRGIASLVFDSLYVLDKTYKPVPLIAQSSELKNNILTVKIKEGLTFSNGSPITPYDVAYSFNTAKQSNFYASRLQNIVSATPSADSVIFTLADADIFVQSVLTFPVILSSTGNNDMPIGSGRYEVGYDDNGKFLKANPDNSRGESLSTEKILLRDISSEESELYLLQSGDLSYYFNDLTDGEYTKIGANTVQLSLNNMIFIGLNSTSEAMADPYVKNAVVSAVNTKTIADSVFSSMCRHSSLPFNPDWYALDSLSLSLSYTDSSLSTAQDLLEKGNYIFAYEDNKYRSKDFEFLKLSIAVNKESQQKMQCAQYISDTLESVGIDVEINALAFEDYLTTLQEGGFDLYIGEVILPANMDLSCFFSENGALSYGIRTDSTVAASYKAFCAGTTDVSTFAKVFENDIPFIPICFRDAVAYFSREFTFSGDITEYEPFMNVSSWKIIY